MSAPTLTLICPACQAPFPAEAGLTDATARAALASCLRLWPVPVRGAVLRYLGLHRPREKALRMDKLARLLEELVTLLESGHVTRHRETRPASITAWGDGLAEVLRAAEAGTLDLPLSGHGLLAQIVWDAAGRAQTQAAAAVRPLHPSHRPAAPVVPDAGRAPPPAVSSTWTREQRAAGLTQAGALLGAIRGRLKPTGGPLDE